MTACLILATVCASSAFTAEDPTLNDKLVEWSKKQVGYAQGRGECTDFILAGLAAVGAKTNKSFTDDPNRGDYVWGEHIGTLYIASNGRPVFEWVDPENKAKPGDVLQFRNVKIKVPRTSVPAQFSHHTAILEKTSDDQVRWTVLHQNVNGKRTVQRHTFQMSRLTGGWIGIYRPQPIK